MTPWIKTELACFTIIGSILTCAHGLNLDFSRLSFYKNPFLHKRQIEYSSCAGNPCESAKPFLCRGTPIKCVELKYVCDQTWDCDDGFDEEPALCNAASRPSVDELHGFLETEAEWMVPQFFNGADLELVAHALTVSNDMTDLQHQIGMTDDNVANLRNGFEAAMEGDSRPFLRMGMNERSWNEVQSFLQQMLDSGFDIYN